MGSSPFGNGHRADGGGTTLAPNTSTPLANAVLAADGYALRFAIYEQPIGHRQYRTGLDRKRSKRKLEHHAELVNRSGSDKSSVVIDAAVAGPSVAISAAQSARGILLREPARLPSPSPAAQSSPSARAAFATKPRGFPFLQPIKLTASQNWEAFAAGIQIDGRSIPTGSGGRPYRV